MTSYTGEAWLWLEEFLVGLDVFKHVARFLLEKKFMIRFLRYNLIFLVKRLDGLTCLPSFVHMVYLTEHKSLKMLVNSNS